MVATYRAKNLQNGKYFFKIKILIVLNTTIFLLFFGRGNFSSAEFICTVCL